MARGLVTSINFSRSARVGIRGASLGSGPRFEKRVNAMKFFKSESGELLAIETNSHVGLVVRRRESYDVAPAQWVASEVTLDDGVLREEDEWGVTTTNVVETTAEDVVAAWGFDPRTAYWSTRHKQWIFPTK